ncbi:bifunctional 3,4-dihydroxy-2-butanone-4-phosphate synthase/GTP cyclohydrolase II [Candidatus Nitrosacidococcus sp. I8]|uniref:bifunctional 3,4-dihydroxy-2-butanone-4-phosphate synthase/GTP cyclohydrolase II n=1 Tax=Candidatus Nitrosacidococcus sp. I8 TaxID=2942908 RepID=UPI0022268B3B|nr:bifunctional 3,4-dihydroxy-2-butanone-4-phosphate synthase/GTP cyclohydrolase II [Candidatus Nitrosacidococcus sp. I8]CAH9017521.1 Riboflavin biosynthesis protein RibBA [Candidatus Nitrosacidococcus sp. I8]
MSLSNIETIIQELQQGKMVILMDDEGRENEGDLIMAAAKVRAQDINFMARYGRGLICLTLTEDRCRQLNLPLMVTDNGTQYSTNFTLSIEAASGVTTGISAADRAHTIQMAVAPQAKPEDLVQPGHIFPLMARSGGVLTRSGHTEAGCDLARLAGFEPAAVIVEILNEDGTMARRPDLELFAQQHNIKLGTVADLIHYRLKHERSITRIAICNLPTEQGTFQLFSYQDLVTGQLHFALVKGEIHREDPILVRVHMADTLSDCLQVQRQDCGWPLRDAMERINQTGSGVVVILHQLESTIDLIRRLKNYQMEDQGIQSASNSPKKEGLRTYGIGAQILTDLGVKKMRVMSAPRKMHGLAGFGLEVVDYVS